MQNREIIAVAYGCLMSGVGSSARFRPPGTVAVQAKNAFRVRLAARRGCKNIAIRQTSHDGVGVNRSSNYGVCRVPAVPTRNRRISNGA
jgi:hypothetical protein